MTYAGNCGCLTSGTGIHQFAFDPDAAESFLQFHAEVGRVRRVLLFLTQRRRRWVDHVDRRIVRP